MRRRKLSGIITNLRITKKFLKTCTWDNPGLRWSWEKQLGARKGMKSDLNLTAQEIHSSLRGGNQELRRKWLSLPWLQPQGRWGGLKLLTSPGAGQVVWSSEVGWVGTVGYHSTRAPPKAGGTNWLTTPRTGSVGSGRSEARILKRSQKSGCRYETLSII